eukprot:XP_001698948.1 predicted protein [Chlamydomonas reinhardtii]
MRECQGCIWYASAPKAKLRMPVCAHVLISDVLHDVHTKSRHLDQSSLWSPARMLYACRARRSGCCCVYSCSTCETPAKNGDAHHSSTLLVPTVVTVRHQ